MADPSPEGFSDEGGVLALLDCAEDLVHESPCTAESLAVAAADAADGAGLTALAARAHYLRARVLAERGELEASMELVEGARALWWEAGEPLAALRTDLGRMQVLDDLGRHPEALAVGEALLRHLDELDPDAREGSGDADQLAWLRAAALDNVGVARGFLGDHVRAIEAHLGSEEAFQRSGRGEMALRSMANRGLALLALGRAHQAMEVLRAVELGFAASGDVLGRATAQRHIATVHRQLGDLVSALQELELARLALEGLGATAEGARLRVVAAGVYLEAGLVTEARAEATAALATTELASMTHDTADARFVLALVAASTGNHEVASAELQVAGRLYHEVGGAAAAAPGRRAEAGIAAAAGCPLRAGELAQEAAGLLAAGGWAVPLVLARLRQAEVAAGGGDDGAAELHLDAVAALLESTPFPHAHHRYRLQRARLHRRQGRTVAAERLLREAADEAEQRGGGLPGHVLRTAFRSGRLDAQDELVDLLIERGGPGDVEAARAASERARARTLVELVTGTVGSHPLRRHRDASSVERDELRSELAAVYSGLLVAGPPGERAQLRSRADALETAVTDSHLRSELAEVTAAPVSRAVHGRPAEVAPAVVGRPQRRRGATVTYHLLGRDLVAFVSRDGEVAARRLRGVVPQIDAVLASLTDQWSRFSMGAAFVRRHESALTATALDLLGSLDRLVVRPLEPLLAGTQGSDLMVVPHGRLQQIPFHALHDGHEHRLAQWSITVGPTAADGQVPRSRPLDPTSSALVLAVPDADAPSVLREAASIADLLPESTVLVGAAATRAALAARVPGPGLLHIACHGLHRARNPLFSALRLGDGWLTAADVLRLDLGGALTTLSACESGRSGDRGGGTEPVGLAWAFLAAGASGVLVSQWLVHDEVTAELMTHYSRLVVAGHPPASALRAAQLAAAAEHPHPYYWAPFTFAASPGGSVPPSRGP